MGVVAKTDTGVRYQVEGPEIARVDFSREGWTGPRVPWARESVDVPLEDAAQLFDGEHVLAWCPKCEKWRQVDVDQLRGGRKRILI
jgi:hypothetical protein